MTVTDALWRNRGALIRTFHTATIHGMVTTWDRCSNLRTVPHEPDFVAGFVLQSTPLIHHALVSLLSQFKAEVSMVSVFCHQKPEVRFDSDPPGSCELGDMLMVYVHTPRLGPTRRNALLLQAKASSHQPYCVGDGERVRGSLNLVLCSQSEMLASSSSFHRRISSSFFFGSSSGTPIRHDGRHLRNGGAAA